MMRIRGYLLFSVVFGLLCFVNGRVNGQWRAYNDLVRNVGDGTAANTTDWTIYSGYTDHNSGKLRNFDTGSTEGMPTVTVTMDMEKGLNVAVGSAGTPAPGTDAYNIFNGIADIGTSIVYYGQSGWWMEIEFSGLDPRREYTFVGTAIRGRDYPERKSVITLIGAESFENTSSDGVLLKDGAVTQFLAGNNSSTGYVVRWEHITVSDQGDGTGSFKIRSEASADSPQGKAYPLNVFMLADTGPTAGPTVAFGDFNEDCTVDLQDLLFLAKDWLGSGGSLANINNDDTVNMLDYSIVAENWLNSWGSLQVSIEPQEAVDLGARWRLDDGPWRDTGAAVETVSTGYHTVAFHSVDGWDPPVTKQFTIEACNQSHITGTYIRQSGSLQVTIEPQEAIEQGGHWRVNGGEWLDSGDTVDGLTTGHHLVEFINIVGWDRPEPQSLQVNTGETTRFTGTYIRHTGKVSVILQPQDAIAAGAQWRIDAGPWLDSAVQLDNVVIGTHTIEFREVADWNSPTSQEILLTKDQVISLTGIYSQHAGSLVVNIEPASVNALGALWRLDGGTWQSGGTQLDAIPEGEHTVEFKSITDWDAPAPQTVGIVNAQVTSLTGTYQVQTGSLTINLFPPEAVEAGARWRVDGGAWLDSGTEVASLAVGTHIVEFLEINGWNEPGKRTILLNGNQQLVDSGIYESFTYAPLIISEFMASNDTALPDPNNPTKFPDWIEIYNPTDVAVNLAGWYLTDDPCELTKWQFPDYQLDSGAFVVVYADNQDHAVAGEVMRTNFVLDKGGEYLGLIAPDGETIVYDFAPKYPPQLTDVSYGLSQFASTLVARGATARYHVPEAGDASLETAWTADTFDDSAWQEGKTGLGFMGSLDFVGADIGQPAPGSWSQDDGIITITGDGDDIWGVADNFYFVYVPLNGDGELSARVLSLENTNNWAKAGVMVRESLAAGSKHAFMCVTPQNGEGRLAFQYRPQTDGSSESFHTDRGQVSLPEWVRIVRQGDNITGYVSDDGIDWQPFPLAADGVTISMSSEVYIGLAVTSHVGGTLNTATFDNVSGSGATSSSLKDDMLGVNSSLWTRIRFNVEDPSVFDLVTLRMRYEDGFVAYLNGHEVARRNAPETIVWNSAAQTDRPVIESQDYESLNLLDYLWAMQPGSNVLAIQGLNDQVDDDEFLVLPELVAASNATVPQYFTNATPGNFNEPGALGLVGKVTFSEKRGFYDEPFDLTLATDTEGAEIRYTLDGSTPSATQGTVYSGPIPIDHTSIVRAVAVKSGYLDSEVKTNTYIFISDVIGQSPNGEAPGPSWPSSDINGQMIDYGMDPDVVNDPRYKDSLRDALLSIPSISIVTDLENLFDPSTGIYVNAGRQGRAWERPASIELLNPDGSKGFQINAGIRIRGGFSRSGGNPKHAFRLFFRKEYGDGKLKYPLFGDEGVDEFDKVDLRTSQNYSWAFQNNSNNTMVREVFQRDTQRDMGQPYTRSRYYHLYIDGQYWGLYMTQERSEARFAASYFGGDSDDYDTIKHEGGRRRATDGTTEAFDTLFAEAMAGFEQDVNYYRVQGLNPDGTVNPAYPKMVDIDNLIVYMIGIFYSGDKDAPISNFMGNRGLNNFYCIYNRRNPFGFISFRHDGEHTLDMGMNDRVGPWTDPVFTQADHFNPQTLHQKLIKHPDYRMRFADLVYKTFYNHGWLTPEVATARLMVRVHQIEQAIIAHSARWGDAKRSTPFTKDDNWLPAVDRVINFLNTRPPTVIAQLQNVGWYPTIAAPTYNQNGGEVAQGFSLELTNPNSSGTLYYTLDGRDPRLPASQSSSGEEVVLLGENAPKRYQVPDGNIEGSIGSILREYWLGIGGVQVSDLTSNVNYPNNPSGSNQLTTFEAPVDWADNYGTRIRGYLHPPADGDYTFWISGDDYCELWLTVNGSRQLIASVPGWTSSRQWDKYSQQQSDPITLTSGQKYAIEALHKEGGGGDSVAVAWQGPTIPSRTIIDGQYLSPAGQSWMTPNFDDSTWPQGSGAVGYERNPGDAINYSDLIGIDMESEMYDINSTCYIRIPFMVSHKQFSQMTLRVKYDDGFVAYLNGVEIARANYSGSGIPAWDDTAANTHDDTAALTFEEFDISEYVDELIAGENVLAIQGLNIDKSDSDFLISVEIVAHEINSGDPSPDALVYTGPITLDQSTHVMARVFDGAWSPLHEETFSVGPLTDNLRITELMYHPADPDPCDPGFFDDDDFEFIELKNIGNEAINLNLVKFSNGVDFTFPPLELGGGQFVVVVKNAAAFHQRYPDFSGAIAGQYEGYLNNKGEKIELQDAIGRTIQEFSYKDGWYGLTDGKGFSLTVVDATADPCNWNEKSGWSASTYRFGSPGSDDMVLPNNAIVINEVLAHSHAEAPDWIELYNTTDDLDINIGGWYLSDDADYLRKFRIPEDTWLDAGQYKVFYEDTDFGAVGDPCNVPFALSENGDTMYLSSGSQGELTGYREQEDFGASDTGVSLGRYRKSTGTYNFVAMATATPGAANSAPLVGPIVISEIMYNPLSGDQNLEYIELKNISDTAVTLYDEASGEPWKFTDGVGFVFPSAVDAVTIQPGGIVMVVKDKIAFIGEYGNMPGGVKVLGPYIGQLSNSGEKLELSRPGDIDLQGVRHYIRVDRVNYSDEAPWPTEPDGDKGDGSSLTRIDPAQYGNDPINWQAATPTPGS